MTESTVIGRQADLASRSLDEIVSGELIGQLAYFFDALVEQRQALILGGVRVFEARDSFLSGKICAGLTHLLVRADRSGPQWNVRLAGFRAVMDFTADMESTSWGIYYAVAGLYALKKAGLLDAAVSPETFEALKEKSDWRRFVNAEDYSLIDLPTNYYGVAFSIARLRMLLGWEDAMASEALLEKTLKHYATHSGTFGFCDDTDGEGRFDRYSILLIAELCERFIETGLIVTPNLRVLLRNAVDVVLKLVNAHGNGFCFGRSLGPYGDTAVLQICAVAAYLEVLTPEERPYAYSLSVAIAEKYIGFWFDVEVHSVNMWDHGRRVDAYRGKSRILGENLSLLHQIISANQLWNQAGFQDVAPHSSEDLQHWLDATQAPFSLIPFAKGVFDRALAIYRDRGRVFSLLIVNGGTGQHMNSPYYPLPFSPGLVEGIADSGPEFAQLMPKLTLQDGTQLIGTAFFKNIRSSTEGSTHRVRFEMDAMTQLGGDAPVWDDRVSVEVEYLFEDGKISRSDRFTPASSIDVQCLALDYISFSSNATVEACNVQFETGAATAFQASGFDTCRTTALHNNPSFRSPNGPMHTLVQCRRGAFAASDPFTVQWTIHHT